MSTIHTVTYVGATYREPLEAGWDQISQVRTVHIIKLFCVFLISLIPDHNQLKVRDPGYVYTYTHTPSLGVHAFTN